MELIKKIVRIGNSSGVVLPKEWLNGKARVELIEKPANTQKVIFEILEQDLADVEGIYLVGSYARKEENEKSDIDVLVITHKTNKKIIHGKYEVILISYDSLKNVLEKNILPFLPMIIEAKAIVNDKLLNYFRNIKLTKKNLSWHIDSTKSILKVNKEKIELDREKGFTGDAVTYSLVLRLREVYIVECLIKNKTWSTQEFKHLIKRISGGLDVYEGYLRIKNNLQNRKKLPIEEADNLYNYIFKSINEQEKWLQKGR